MNQLRCKQLKRAVVVSSATSATGFFTGTVEKLVSFQAETMVQ